MEPMGNVVDHDEEKGPCRETASGILQREVGQLKRRIAGLECLLALAQGFKAGSPEEEAMWDMLQQRRANYC